MFVVLAISIVYLPLFAVSLGYRTLCLVMQSVVGEHAAVNGKLLSSYLEVYAAESFARGNVVARPPFRIDVHRPVLPQHDVHH